MGWSCVPKNSAVLTTEVYCSPSCPGLPCFPLFPSFQIFAIKEENNRLRQEKQVLKNKLEELKKRVLWNDPVRVTQCVWALGSAGKGTSLSGEAAGECSWALCDDWNSSC